MVRAVFLVLVLVTVAAFFVTQSLKTEEPLVLRFAVAQPEVFSPNGDRVGDSLRGGLRPLPAGGDLLLGDRLRGRGGAPPGG